MRRVLLAILLLSFLFVAGCFEIVYDISIDSDDIATFSLKMGMPSMYAFFLDDLIEEAQRDGFEVQTEYDGDRVWFIAKKMYLKGDWEVPPPPTDSEFVDTSQSDFYVTDYFFFKKYTLDIEYNYYDFQADRRYSDDFDYLGSIPVKFVVRFPGRIHKTNAHKEEDGAAVWNYVITKNGKIDLELVNYKIKYLPIAVTLIVPAILVGLGFVLAAKVLQPKSSGIHVISRIQGGGEAAREMPAEEKPIAPTPPPTPSGPKIYEVHVPYPDDISKAERVINTLAEKMGKTPLEIVDTLKRGEMMLTFKQKSTLEKNLAILKNAGFRPRVTTKTS
jgi:hypothetical protein